MSGIGRVAAILGNVTFGELVDVHCAIPMIIVSVLLVFGHDTKSCRSVNENTGICKSKPIYISILWQLTGIVAY
jgi:hypothetical protein